MQGQTTCGDNAQSPTTTKEQRDVLRTADFLLRRHRSETGNGLDAEPRTKYQSLQAALAHVKADLLQAKPKLSKELVSRMYSYVGIVQEQAKTLGYSNHVEQVLDEEDRMASSVDQIMSLNETVKNRVLPHVLRASSGTGGRGDDFLSDLLGPQKTEKTRQQLTDERTKIRLEHYVTLEGAISFVSKLAGDILGVSILQDKSIDSWNRDVRCYHVVENGNNYLGSFYLDPFERPGKLARSVTAPVHIVGATAPVACVALNISPPTWDTDEPTLSWQDMETLLHEVGHVLDIVLSKSAFGSLAGPAQTFPLDRSELLPKVNLIDTGTRFLLLQLPHHSLTSPFCPTVHGTLDDGNLDDLCPNCLLEQQARIYRLSH